MSYYSYHGKNIISLISQSINKISDASNIFEENNDSVKCSPIDWTFILEPTSYIYCTNEAY